MKKIKRFKKLKHSRFRYFTMIEMLAVAAILAILAGLSFGAYSAVQKARANAKTEGNLNTLHAALQAFKTKYGYYPQTDGTRLPVYICQGISTSQKDGSKMIFGADMYKSFSAELLQTSIHDGQENSHPLLIVTDGFKDPVKSESRSFIYYQCPGDRNKDSYDLLSAGPDRQLNTKDDIWPQNHKKQSNTK